MSSWVYCTHLFLLDHSVAQSSDDVLAIIQLALQPSTIPLHRKAPRVGQGSLPLGRFSQMKKGMYRRRAVMQAAVLVLVV